MGAYPRPGDAFGRYLVGRRIGRGGMGSVFEAVQSDLNRSVALKVLSPELSEEPDFRLRFGREATMLAALDSPHIIQVYETGDQDGSLYIATQLVKGRDLAQLVEATGGLTLAQGLNIVAQAASGLADAHAVGLLHRDVKPSNILVRESHDEPFAYLCDFGIARPAEGGHTRTSGVLGTVAFMAPERYEGAPATFASDIYALGCVLWSALTGRDPFGGTTYVQIALAHLHQPVPQLPGDTPVNRAVNVILRRSMAKVPAERFKSAGQMRASLVSAIELARAQRPPSRADTDNTTVTGHGAPPPPKRTVGGLGMATEPRSATAVSTLNDLKVRWSRPATGAVAAMALTVITVIVVLVTRGLEGSPSGLAAGERSASASGSSGPTPTTRAPRSAPSSSSLKSMRCWNSSTAPSAARCPVPEGRAGMASVFQPFDDQCHEPTSVQASGKAEVFVCFYTGYLIRYSRWQPASDRSAYYDESNPGAQVAVWRIDDMRAGTMWTSFETDPAETKPFQRSATYDDQPFSVSVEGRTAGDRASAWERVRAQPPSHIGLQ